MVGGDSQRRLPGGGKICATFVKAGLGGQEGRPPEGWNVMCKDSGTTAPRRPALGRPWKNTLSKVLSELPALLNSQVEKPVGQVEMSP